MAVEVLVNPEGDKNNQAQFGDDYQVIIPVQITYSDGYVRTMRIYVHGEQINDREVAKAVTVNMNDPVLNKQVF